VFSVPVGEQGVHYHGIDIEEMETTGPQAIAVITDGTIAIVDTVGGQLLRYSPSGSKLASIQLDGAVGVSDAVPAGDDLVLLDESALEPAFVRVSSGGAVSERSPLPHDARQRGLSGITVDDSGAVLAQLKGGLEFLSLDGVAAAPKRIGAAFAVKTPSLADPAADLSRGYVVRDGSAFATVAVDEMVGGMRVLAVLPSGEVFVLVEEVAFTPALEVDQRIYRFAADGRLTGVARVPISECTTYVKHGVAVGPDGEVYALITRKDRADVVRLGFRPHLPRILHRTVEAENAVSDSVTTCSITRTTIESNCNAYCNDYQWYNASALNGTCRGRGKPLYLGDVPAYYDSVSYDWGGWDPVSVFNSDIASGYDAGDINKGGTESCSRGVDCSGFVSRSWGLTTRYTTHTLEDVSYPISTSSVGTGDLMLKVGVHCALVDYTSSNGLQIWESTTYFNYDRVTYHTKSC
jgi:hypothetical protein